jgi:energy-coupling factor transporter transmembrane protein EcfT
VFSLDTKNSHSAAAAAKAIKYIYRFFFSFFLEVERICVAMDHVVGNVI